MQKLRTFWVLLKHELGSLWVSAGTYVAAVLFLALMAGVYIIGLHEASLRVQEGPLPVWFFQNYFWPVLGVVPLLTMRLLAEPRRMGTLETLLCTPATPALVVCSKFVAAWLFYMLLWACTLLFPLCVHWLAPGIAQVAGVFNKPALIGGFTFIGITAWLHIAIGLFASSLTRSQLVAGVLSFALLFAALIGTQLLGAFMPSVTEAGGFATDALAYIQTTTHLKNFTAGVLDTRALWLNASAATLLLIWTTFSVRNQALK